MPPKSKTIKDKPGKQDKSKASSDDPKKLKAANAIKVRHILCEKQSKGILSCMITCLTLVLEAIAKLKEVF